jgi:hypothetical protein
MAKNQNKKKVTKKEGASLGHKMIVILLLIGMIGMFVILPVLSAGA